MRRPLCLLCFAFVSAVLIFMLIFPVSLDTLGGKQGEQLTVEGKVSRKEFKNDSLLIYLDETVISDRLPVSWEQEWNHITSVDIANQKNLSNQETNQNLFQTKENTEYDSSPKGVLCYMQKAYEPKIGSIVRIRGKTQEFKGSTNEGQFDMGRYYKTRGLDFKLMGAEVVAESREYSFRAETLYKLRKRGEAVYDRYFTPENASIMKVMVFGNKVGLEGEVKEIYQRAGISHLLVISGLHISMIGMGIHKLLRRLGLPLLPAAGISILLMRQYGDMTGMGTSSFRAIFMFSLLLLAGITRRSYDMITAMAIAAACVAAAQPLYVLDTGFLLSFGAILAIGLVNPAIGFRVRKKKTVLYKMADYLAASLSVSLSVLVTTLPILMLSFYEITPVSVLLNLLVIPPMTILLLAGLLLLPISAIGGWLASVVILPCNGILFLYKRLCLASEQLPGSTVVTGKPQPWQILFYIAGLLLLILFYELAGYFIKYTGIALLVILVTCHPVKGLTICMLDVGQGDCLFIRTESGNSYLVDGGSSSEKDIGQYGIIPFLKSKKISQLNAVFVTHSDEDHISGLRELLEKCKEGNGIAIEKLVLPHIKEVYRDENYSSLEGLAKEMNIEMIYFKEGSSLQDGKMNMECLHPGPEFQPENANAYSMVLSLSYGEFNMLFTGDLEGTGESLLLEKLLERNVAGTGTETEVLKVAHHGSRNSTSDQLLEQLSAELALISCGRDNSYGHPHGELLERLENHGIAIAATPDCGQVTIYTDGAGYEVRRQIITPN